MRFIKFLFIPILAGCIQTDFEDPFPPTLRIDNSVNDIDFRVSGSYVLKAVYTDDTGEEASTEVEWQSSNEDVVSFSGNVASVHAEGFATFTVRANGLVDDQTIETFASRGALTISGSVQQIQIGSSSAFRFNFIDVNGVTKNDLEASWSSSNEDIASVSASGQVSALSAGQTIISVTVDGIGQTIALEVTEDPVQIDPEVRLLAFFRFISTGGSAQFEADLLQANGTVDRNATIEWSSSDEGILTIDQTGVATALSAGVATITAAFGSLSASVEVTIEGEGNQVRSGTLRGTGYDIAGSFSLSVNEDGDLILVIENYAPDGPGPYFYLTNQESNVNNGLSLGEAKTAGDFTINISELDENVKLSTFNYLMVWCEPFNVRLGVGAFDN